MKSLYTQQMHTTYVRILSVDSTGLLDSRNICTLYRVEMQQYIDISPYRDALNSDTVSIHIKLYRYIEYRDILMYVLQCIDIQTVYVYVQYFMIDALVVYCGCQFYSLESCSLGKKFCSSVKFS